MAKFDFLIVGAGLFGSLTAKYLADKKYSVLLIDSVEPLAASKCASGIFRNGWIKKIKDKADISLPIVKKYTKIKSINLFNKTSGETESYSQIDVNGILEIKPSKFLTFHNAKLDDIAYDENGVCDKAFIQLIDGEYQEIEIGKALIITAGFYTDNILKEFELEPIGLDASWGITYTIAYNLKTPFIETWAPFRQLYGYPMERGGKTVTYFAGGVGIKNPNGEEDKRIDKSVERMNQQAAENGLPVDKIIEINEGVRPYLKDVNSSMVVQRGKNIFAAAGGAKNSSVLCGYVAFRLFEMIQEAKL